ncbi:MerR family transcriptional regulator [Bacillus sp. Bva_UNVM-123]|uniref:MerR family transcriptional regulator n=1 Tax=Bacillus sp. Bva_UNVM-123 TaxID=2829798 RepID=UPI00391F05AA
MVQTDLLTVGELAKVMGVTVRTLQYYDKEGLLKPSAKSEGGRRLYSNKDLVKLHQILSLKYLGFPLDKIKNMMLSLDTPDEVAFVLEKQYMVVEEQIKNLQKALTAIEALRKEVLLIEEVNFSKYADIISLLKMENKNYWVLKLFDNQLSSHIRDRFVDNQELGAELYRTYFTILEEAVLLNKQNEPVQSRKSIELAGKWWAMISEFTGGDMSLLPKLMSFNDNKKGWDEEIAAKQKQVDDYIGKALMCYFTKNGISIPEMEG